MRRLKSYALRMRCGPRAEEDRLRAEREAHESALRAEREAEERSLAEERAETERMRREAEESEAKAKAEREMIELERAEAVKVAESLSEIAKKWGVPDECSGALKDAYYLGVASARNVADAMAKGVIVETVDFHSEPDNSSEATS